MSKKLKPIMLVFLAPVLLLVGIVYSLSKTDSREVEHSSWSKQGEWIVFSCAPRGGSRSSLYLVRPDGSELTRLTTDKVVAVSPTWSPNGEEIVFEDYLDELYKLKRGAEDLIPLRVSDQHDRQELFPDWSPDGQWIAFILRHEEEYDLIQANVNDGVEKTLVRDVERGPIAWSPDGQWIAYQLAGGIHKVKVDNGETQIAISGDTAYPAWSPNGKLITFSNLSDGDIYVAREDGNEITRLTDFPEWARYPDWSPNGEWIVFVSAFERPDTQLFKIRADGSELQRIVDTDCSAFFPDWIKMSGS